jgi:hypothetical protein
VSETALREPPPSAPLAPTDPLADLILVRLLPAKKSLSPKALREDVGVFFRRPPTADHVAETVAALRAAGLITPKGQRATDAGRVRARGYLGVGKLPPRANWGTLKAKYLVPKALGLPANSDEARAAADPKTLAPLLLKRKFGLPARTPLTLSRVFDALACQLLGFPEADSLKDLRAAVISKKLGGDLPLTGEQLTEDGARLLLGTRARGANGFRAVALAGFADGKPAPAAGALALTTFAGAVKAAARACPTGRFGDNKVFISHVWKRLANDPRFAPLGLTGFKARLVEAHRADLLTLSRADLVQLMDPADVSESETPYLNAAFHFVLLEKE